MKEFVYVAQAARVVFSVGAVSRVPKEVELLGAKKVFILCGPHQRRDAYKIAEELGSRAAGVFDRAAMHVPIEIAREAQRTARNLESDCAIAIGGGSTIGLAKALALDSGISIIAVPTTFAGSEMTSIYGLTEAGVKRTGRDPRVLPKTVVYDPALSSTLPVELAVTSGMNAIAHSAEGLYARDGNPIMDLMAVEGMRAIATAIPRIKSDAQDLEARGLALYGAWLCGTVLGNVGMALHHKLCHTLGGSFNLDHAGVHTVMLPHTVAYNAPAIPVALDKMRDALKVDDPALALFELARSNGAPTSLKELGMRSSDLDQAAEIAIANPYWNPRPIERAEIRSLLQNAWAGDPP